MRLTLRFRLENRKYAFMDEFKFVYTTKTKHQRKRIKLAKLH